MTDPFKNYDETNEVVEGQAPATETEVNEQAEATTAADPREQLRGPRRVVQPRHGGQLTITAELTSQANEAAIALEDIVYKKYTVEDDRLDVQQEVYDNPAALDKMINELINVEDFVDIKSLKTYDTVTLEKALKSQQSKRSRAKSAVLSLETYYKLMSAAIAEHALRIALDKPKNASAGGRATVIELTDEQIDMYKENPDALGKAIRNVQSKKSIYRGKANADFESEYWQKLIDQEAQLKAIRDNNGGVITKEAQQAIEMRDKAVSLIEDVDTSKLKASDAKELLAQLQEALAADNQ